jgi:hypothetical protein
MALKQIPDISRSHGKVVVAKLPNKRWHPYLTNNQRKRPMAGNLYNPQAPHHADKPASQVDELLSGRLIKPRSGEIKSMESAMLGNMPELIGQVAHLEKPEIDNGSGTSKGCEPDDDHDDRTVCQDLVATACQPPPQGKRVCF